ncbi:Transcription initiation factor TFIID subunit 2 [Podosphaera aphanis]|nr:Transcription initiation factor TFIID subunit 2 [Podosphaera aphanis]
MPGLLLEMDVPDVAPSKTREYGFVVSHQKVDLDIDFSTPSITGCCEITIIPQTKDLKLIRLDARQSSISDGSVAVNGVLANYIFEDPMEKLDIPDYQLWSVEQWEMQRDRLKPLTDDTRSDGSLIIIIPKKVHVEEVDQFTGTGIPVPAQRTTGSSTGKPSLTALDGGPTSMVSTLTPKITAEQPARFQPLVITIPFSTTRFRDGLHFVGLGEGDARFPHIYTRHSINPGTASCIFPCVDNPAMRCTWEISIKCSRFLGDALKRKPLPNSPQNLRNILIKKGLLDAVAQKTVEEYEIPLSDDEKMLEMSVVCSGEHISEITDRNDCTKKILSFLCSTVVAPHHIGFAVGPFESVDLSEFREVGDEDKLEQAQAIPVLGYCLPGRSDELRHTCTPMAHAIDWFMLNFGSYPFTECRFVFVDDQIRDTEHTASLSICSSRLLFGEDIIDPEMENTRKLVHAVASQWIGVSIVPNQSCDRWATIGLSYFMTDLFMKTLCGNNEYVFRQKQRNDQCVEEDFQRPSLYELGKVLHLGPFESNFMALKAPLVLSILDRRIIKASGSVGLIRVISKIIVTSNTGTSTDSIISTENFRKTTEKITKYRQTESFWNHWVFGTGCPTFAITQKFNKKRLCVEMTITQTQDKRLEKGRKLDQKSFMKDFKEELKGVSPGEFQTVFTGPLTIRIHEADGTPYEHIIELREGHAKIEIPYNTKYKRLKRNRLQKERAAAAEHAVEGGEEALYYCLGDLLTTPGEMSDWGLTDWDTEQEASMAQESYEWLRVDADHEWICEKVFTNMKAYMYVSQLQQDRDIVAQYESMMYLKPLTSHPLVATFLVRTLMDSRYFYGIRVMGAEFLKTHATKAHNWVGLHQLQKVYQEFFSYPGTNMSRTNDFTDKRAYYVEMAIARSLSQIRAPDGMCPKEARHFLLDMLRFNDNTNNEYSDNFKIANLLSALTTSLISSEPDPDTICGNSKEHMDIDAQEINLQNGNIEDGMMGLIDTEPEDFKNAVIEELDRYRRMDEWINSYQNLFTVTVLDCKQKLMKANVIPIDPIEFVQYLHDGTSDFIRIKASEALINLGFTSNNSILKLLLNFLSTDPSPYTRSHLFRIFYQGFATIAFGQTNVANQEHSEITLPSTVERHTLMNGNSNNHSENAVNIDDDLIVEENVSLEVRKTALTRISSIKGALSALRSELKRNKVLKEAFQRAIKSPVIRLDEQLDLLDICSVLYDPSHSLTVKLRMPRYWKAKNMGKGIILFKQTKKVRTKPLRSIEYNESPKVTTTKVTPTTAPVRFSISTSTGTRTSLPGSSVVSNAKSTHVVAKAHNETMQSSSTTKPPSIAIKTHNRVPTTISLKPLGSMKTPPKRSLEPKECSDERPRKIVKLKPLNMQKVATIQSRPPKPTSFRGKAPSKGVISASTQSQKLGLKPTKLSSPAPAFPGLAPQSSSVAKVRKPLPEGRKPLPGGPAGQRQPLPGSTPRTPLPASLSGDLPPPKKGFILKLKTGAFKGGSPKPPH